VNESLLVNALGHSAGVLLFGIFIALLVRDRRAWGKPFLAASLALLWNLGSLVVLGTGDLAGRLTDLTVAISFSVLSLLPAVLFDLCLAGKNSVFVQIGYGLSAVSVALHVAELFTPVPPLHRVSLGLITIGFGTLTVLAAWRYQQTPRLIGTMSLFLLAMSFVHLGNAHAQQIWSQELAFHHAAIPLALLVLLQDFRFVLLDAFLRFLANVLLAAIVVSGVAVAWKIGILPPADTPFHLAALLAGACLLLISFAVLRAKVQNVLTRVVFRRRGSEELLRSLKRPVVEEARYVAAAAREIGRFVEANADLAAQAPAQHHYGIEAAIPLRLPGGTQFLVLGRRGGGRRYLSEDLQTLYEAAGVIEQQVEQFRESEMRRLVSQAELRALQSQIHPHFLFNALNALYGIIPREAKGARDTVLNLADIFRYFLETRKTMVPLEEEMRIVRAYLDVERLRLGEKLRVEFEMGEGTSSVAIPVLSIQPLVENAVKHAVAAKAAGGTIRVRAVVGERGAMTVTVSDTGPGFAQNKSGGGVGLENVSRRLELCYGGESRLEVRSTDCGCEVSFTVQPEDVPSRKDARTARVTA
jgi:two-component system LytT family sensor kinase